jgi:hypothetical protein
VAGYNSAFCSSTEVRPRGGQAVSRPLRWRRPWRAGDCNLRTSPRWGRTRSAEQLTRCEAPFSPLSRRGDAPKALLRPSRKATSCRLGRLSASLNAPRSGGDKFPSHRHARVLILKTIRLPPGPCGQGAARSQAEGLCNGLLDRLNELSFRTRASAPTSSTAAKLGPCSASNSTDKGRSSLR